MEKKYLVICVDENRAVCSVKECATEEEANAALAKDAKETYEEMEASQNSSIEVWPGHAEVSDGDDSIWTWSVYPI